ncbi:MAG TPA: response regulator [Bacillota bacterium]|nr:response regulator [Bacillota bacterium]
MNTPLQYIIIDDDPFNNLICKTIISKTISGANVQTFVVPEEGYSFLKTIVNQVVLFLDINMPTMTGWEFLEMFDKLEDGVKSKVKVFILSSSVDERDIEKAHTNKYVSGFISKPLKPDVIKDINEPVLP